VNLSQLIGVHRAGRSYNELERDCGGKPSAARLQQLGTQPMKNFPDPPTVRALAQGLRVSEVAVVLAAAESLDLDVSSSMPRLLQMLPSTASEMSEQQVAAVARLIDSFMSDPRMDLVWSDVDIAADEPEPTVKDVLRARQQQQHLRPVAHGGDQADADIVEELARKARRRQTGGSDDE